MFENENLNKNNKKRVILIEMLILHFYYNLIILYIYSNYFVTKNSIKENV